MPIVFNCDISQIARSGKDIKESTKAFVGPLEPGIFDQLVKHNIEQIWTSFPEGKIRKETVQIGGKSEKQLEEELEKAKIQVSGYAQSMMRNKEFTTLPSAQLLDTVKLRVEDLGFGKQYPNTDQVYKRAQELGLELCSAETGPHLRLKDTAQPMDDYYWIAMKQIADSGGYPYVFGLRRRGGKLWLRGCWAEPGGWYPEDRLVFSLRKSEPQNPQTPSLFNRLFKR